MPSFRDRSDADFSRFGVKTPETPTLATELPQTPAQRSGPTKLQTTGFMVILVALAVAVVLILSALDGRTPEGRYAVPVSQALSGAANADYICATGTHPVRAWLDANDVYSVECSNGVVNLTVP